MLIAVFSGLKAMVGFQPLDVKSMGAPRRGALNIPKPPIGGKRRMIG